MDLPFGPGVLRHDVRSWGGSRWGVTSQAMLEIGRAERTCFVVRYLLDRNLQRQIEEGLNVVESGTRRMR